MLQLQVAHDTLALGFAALHSSKAYLVGEVQHLEAAAAAFKVSFWSGGPVLACLLLL